MQQGEWHKYIEGGWGITPTRDAPGWREFTLETTRGPRAVRSMLTRYEIAILYALARDHYTGVGAIVDAGPLTGVTTSAFARGMEANARAFKRAKRIHSFDLFDHIPLVDCLERRA